MKIKYFAPVLSILWLMTYRAVAQETSIDYERLCRSRESYGFSQEQCDRWSRENPNQVHRGGVRESQQPRVYKIRLRDAATGNARQWSFFSPGDADREEWVVVTVTGKLVKVRHATNIENKLWGNRQWYDHPATALRICDASQFEALNCQTVQGDTILLPEGKTIHDVQIDFKYSEGGGIYTRSVQIPADAEYD